jgi:hypothetical protein
MFLIRIVGSLSPIFRCSLCERAQNDEQMLQQFRRSTWEQRIRLSVVYLFILQKFGNSRGKLEWGWSECSFSYDYFYLFAGLKRVLLSQVTWSFFWGVNWSVKCTNTLMSNVRFTGYRTNRHLIHAGLKNGRSSSSSSDAFWKFCYTVTLLD